MRIEMSELECSRSDDGRESPDLFEEEFSTPLSYAEEDSNEEWGAVDGYGYCIPPDTTTAGQRDHTLADWSVSLNPSPSAPLSRIGLNDNKAGMEGLDKAKINRIILEASKGSKYYENELKKEKQVSRRVTSMLKELERVTPAQRAAALRAADKELEMLEAERDLSCIIVHIDMDAFYASVEIRDNPRLKDVPMAVGSTSMLSTSNYLARRYGVRAAMPGFIARKLCPDLVIVPVHFAKYRAASEVVRGILAHYDPHFRSVGLDESYLDLTEFVKLRIDQGQKKAGSFPTTSTSSSEHHPDTATAAEPLTPLHWRCAEEVVEEMRREIRERTALTASAGLAPNMMLAKVASDMNKPDGQCSVAATRDAVVEFVQKLPVRKISGIGKVTECMLNALNVTTCGDLYQQRAVLRLLFSESSSTHFLGVSLGLGSTHVDREYDRKSMSTERTFAEISSVTDLQRKCQELCCDLARDMERNLIKGHTVTLKLKSVHFEVKTRAVTLPQPASSADQLYSAASELLSAEIKACAPSLLRLRLMGVRISCLQKGEGGEEGSRGGRMQESLDVFVHPHSANSATTSSDTAQDAMATSTHTDMSQSDGIGSSIHTVRCPICGQRLDNAQGDFINTHIDECLNRPVISSITASPTAQLTRESPKKLEVSTACKSTISPRKTQGRGRRGRGGKKEVAAGSRKRQLRQNDTSEVDCCTRKRRKTLDYFWNN